MNRRKNAPAPPPSSAQPARSVSERPAAAVRRGFASRAWAFLKTGFGVALALSVSGAAAWLAGHYARTSPRFSIADIKLRGADHRTSEDVALQGGVTRGENIFATDPEMVRRKLLSDPWIVEARVTRKLPSTLEIEVKERKAAALVALGETMMATRDGTLFKKLEAGDPMDLPVITGLDVTQISEDRKGAEIRVRKALDLADEYMMLDIAPRYPLGEVHLKPDGTVSIVVGHTAIVVELGMGPYRRKLEQCSRVLREAERRAMRVDAVLLDNDVRPERVVVRVR